MNLIGSKTAEHLTEYEFYVDERGNFYLQSLVLNKQLNGSKKEMILFRNQDGILIRLSQLTSLQQLNPYDPPSAVKSDLLSQYHQSLTSSTVANIYDVTNVRDAVEEVEHEDPKHIPTEYQSSYEDEDYHNGNSSFFDEFLPAEGLGWDELDFENGDYNPDDDKIWY